MSVAPSPPKKPRGHYTDTKANVDVPEWAEQFEIGDDIHWTHDEVGGVQTSEIIGFSTFYDIGYPVIEPPEQIGGPSHVSECAVTRECWFPPFEWGDDRE